MKCTFLNLSFTCDKSSFIPILSIISMHVILIWQPDPRRLAPQARWARAEPLTLHLGPWRLLDRIDPLRRRMDNLVTDRRATLPPRQAGARGPGRACRTRRRPLVSTVYWVGSRGSSSPLLPARLTLHPNWTTWALAPQP